MKYCLWKFFFFSENARFWNTYIFKVLKISHIPFFVGTNISGFNFSLKSYTNKRSLYLLFDNGKNNYMCSFNRFWKYYDISASSEKCDVFQFIPIPWYQVLNCIIMLLVTMWQKIITEVWYIFESCFSNLLHIASPFIGCLYDHFRRIYFNGICEVVFLLWPDNVLIQKNL